MLARTATRTALAAACSLAAAAGALGAAGCGSSGKSAATGASSGPAAPATIAEAAYKTTAAGGAHVSLAGTITAPGLGSPLTLSGSGAFSFAAREGSLAFTISGLPSSAQAAIGASSLQLNALFKSGSVYIGSPVFAAKLPGGARWLKVNVSEVAQKLGIDPSSLSSGGANPAQYLQELRAAGGTVRVVGHDTVRGTPTTHYAASIDVLKAAEAQGLGRSAASRALLRSLVAKLGLTHIPVDVWVDAQGLVRKELVHVSAHGATASIQIEFFDFGAVPPVTAPAASEVFEVSSKTLQGLTAG